MDLVLTFDESGGFGTNTNNSIIFCSVSGLQLGQVLPNKSIEFTLELFPTIAGLHVNIFNFITIKIINF